MITYTLAAIGAGMVLAFGIPLMERLLRRIKPLTPKQEEAEFMREKRGEVSIGLSARRSVPITLPIFRVS